MEKKTKKVAELLKVAKGRTKALVMPHNYADPDALAAALALKTLLEAKLDIPATIAFNGVVGREENKVLCEVLGIEALPANSLDMDDFDLVALVDCQPGAGNNALPPRRRPDIVVDHHPALKGLSKVPFADVRSSYGASATIVTEYLFDAGVEIGEDLATALLYGIKTDALNIGRKTFEVDIKAYLRLFPLADKEKLMHIEGARLPRDYFKALREAIDEGGTYDDVLVSDLGLVENPGMIGEMADLFLRFNEVQTVLCHGIYDDKVLISIRTLDPGIDAGRVIRHAVGERGTAGGHATMAGGQIPLEKGTLKEGRAHMSAVMAGVFAELGIEGKRKKRVV